MKVLGIDGLDGKMVADELRRGARFVIYQYCISILIISLRRPSDIYFVRAGQSAITKGLGFSMVSLLLGWWGIPWGPIYTIGAVITNFSGGKDVTQEVIEGLKE
jgi:hypothetical protein